MVESTLVSLTGAKVVARYADGKIVKGYTYDFQPRRPRFHIFPDPHASREPISVMVRELKAVFFVRDFAGNAQYKERKQFLASERVTGRVEVTFKDGEVLVGIADGADQEAPGLFLVPVDPRSNNLRVYAVSSYTRSVRYLRSDPHGRRVLPPARREAPGLLPRRVFAWLLESPAS